MEKYSMKLINANNGAKTDIRNATVKQILKAVSSFTQQENKDAVDDLIKVKRSKNVKKK